MRNIFLIAVFVALLTSCAVSTTTLVPENPVTKVLFRDKPEFNPVKVESIAPYITSGTYKQRAQTLFVLFDASSSTTEDYKGQNGFKAANDNVPSKLEAQREMLHRMNQTVAISAPTLKLEKIGLRSIGLGNCDGYGDRYTDLHQDIKPYNQAEYDASIETIKCSHGRSEIGRVLIKDQDTENPINVMLNNDRDKSVSDDLVNATGNISLVIISDLSKHPVDSIISSVIPDGISPYLSQSDQKEIRDLRAKYGNRLCVYNVWMNSANRSKEEEGSNESEDFSIQELSYSADNPPDCGSPAAFTAERVAETDGMKKFMREVLLSPVPQVRVSDDCSTRDSDGDGVNDCNDKCPNTVRGTPVNKLGCWIVDVKFDNDSSQIKPKYYPLLDKLAADINTHFPNMKIEIQGHTSSTASAPYNLRLSMRRAEAVTKYLNKRLHGSNKLIPRGYGLTRPIDTNETELGRSNNRRVQLEVLQ